MLKGFKFGLLLQLAVGPVCLLVFQTAAAQGLLKGMELVSAVVLVDGLYITLSFNGVAAFLENEKIKARLKGGASLVLVLFGVNIFLGAFGAGFLPNLASLFPSFGGIFIQGLVLTASNPLTILFWGGMLTTQMLTYQWTRRQLFSFSIGCVLATLLFLSLVALLGSSLGYFIPGGLIQGLNALVGLGLIFFGIRQASLK